MEERRALSNEYRLQMSKEKLGHRASTLSYTEGMCLKPLVSNAECVAWKVTEREL